MDVINARIVKEGPEIYRLWKLSMTRILDGHYRKDWQDQGFFPTAGDAINHLGDPEIGANPHNIEFVNGVRITHA